MSKTNANTYSTPLYSLSKASCKQNESRLFQNQVVMYQLIIPFISDQLNSFSNSYNPISVDYLISDIRRYLEFMHKYPNEKINIEETRFFPNMHRYIYDNIANRDSGLSMPPFYGDSTILSVMELRGENNLESNINNTIKDRRALPKKIEKLFKLNSSDYTPILYRCFWILQYYFVYYTHSICSISPLKYPHTHFGTQFIEYFPLNPQKSYHIYKTLKQFCSSYSNIFQHQVSSKIDLLSLSRIIIDILVEQLNLRQKLQLVKIIDASEFAFRKKEVMTETEQYMEFQKYINGFGTDSYDRLNMLKKFALTNCYAAEELATAYYWGKTFVIGEKNYYEIEADYNKAAKWYMKAIENSNPPMQSACWSLSYTLTNMHYDTDEELELAEKKAIEYLKLAGEYPAAYNRIAWFIFRDAEKNYDKWKGNISEYEDILLQFLAAIRLADQAGAMYWFYGNNQISLFLMKHKNDLKLLNDLRKHLTLNIPLDLKAQLSYAASYQSPWALKHLALYHIENKQKKEAKILLKQAIESNYNAAYYEMAKHFYKEGGKKWMLLMQKSSEFSYPPATYELFLQEKNHKEKERLLSICQQQILSQKQINSELLSLITNL